MIFIVCIIGIFIIAVVVAVLKGSDEHGDFYPKTPPPTVNQEPARQRNTVSPPTRVPASSPSSGQRDPRVAVLMAQFTAPLNLFVQRNQQLGSLESALPQLTAYNFDAVGQEVIAIAQNHYILVTSGARKAASSAAGTRWQALERMVPIAPSLEEFAKDLPPVIAEASAPVTHAIATYRQLSGLTFEEKVNYSDTTTGMGQLGGPYGAIIRGVSAATTATTQHNKRLDAQLHVIGEAYNEVMATLGTMAIILTSWICTTLDAYQLQLDTALSEISANGADQTGTYAGEIDAEKECPMCAEKVKAQARICRFCRHDFQLT